MTAMSAAHVQAKQQTTAPAGRGLSVLSVLALAVWLGMAAGLLEVAIRVLFRSISPTGRLYLVSRHFVWLTPLANVVLFLGVGLVLALLAKVWPKLGSWLCPRFLLALALLPALAVAVPNIFPEAWFLLSLGIAVRTVPLLQAHAQRLRAAFIWGFFLQAAVIVLLAGSVVASDWIKERREQARALPPAGAANVLLIVLDTVRQDHLSLHGYRRPTTPVLERLARRGIRFDAARATAPWTLASHASLFTGRWPHELGVTWLSPIRNESLTLAEYLADHGYATAGFVANTQYCSYDTRLDRGFAHYEDYVDEWLSPLRMSLVFREFFTAFSELASYHPSGPIHSIQGLLTRWSCYGIRKDAERVNHSFLTWLDRRKQPDRPFFAFLNYLDAHAPYELPPAGSYVFGRKPQTDDELSLVNDLWPFLDKSKLPRSYVNLAADCYDSCIAYLDRRLGELFDELARRGTLESTWIVITSDHGEGLGEHGLFLHGESLFATEIHVPLLIVPPAGRAAAAVVPQPVSLRQVPATVADVLGLEQGQPFPARSLASLWTRGVPSPGQDDPEPAFSELLSPNPSDPNQGRSPAHRGPLIALAEEQFVYIRNQRDGGEQLFDRLDDPRELTNLVSREAMQPVLRRFRDHLRQAFPHLR